jgi:gliding motility-associated protein GldM
MAGGKETPRQKMIGMMYLVLTALLALQIKDEVLEQFVLIDNGLKTSNATYEYANAASVTGIQKAYQDLGAAEKDKPAVDAAAAIRSETLEILSYIEQLKDSVGFYVGGKDEFGTFSRSKLKKYEEPTLFLVKKKNAEVLEKRLNDYTASVLGKTNGVLSVTSGNEISNWETLALAGKDIPFYGNSKKDKKLAKKDFSHLNFDHSPLASVLAQMTFFQNQILSRESDALNRLASSIGATNIKGFDQISATILPVSNIVTAGTDFQAEMFLTAASTAITPTMTSGGRPITVDANGRGQIKFKVSARENEYNADGLARKTFTGQVVFDQGDEEITEDVSYEYYVAKPTIVVRSESIETLLLDCANNLNIDVPSLGAAYQPAFTTTGGRSINGAQKGQLTVVPTSAEVTISVTSAGNYIGDKVYSVEAPPRPSFQVKVDGKAYDAQKGISAAPRSFRLELIPDANFKRKYPDDARYLVTKGRVLRATGSNGKGSLTINSPTLDFNINQLRAGAKAGDRYVIEIDEIIRVNFEDKRIPMPYKKTMTISFN